MFFSIYKYKLLRDFRDIKMVLLLIVLPIILISILGTATGDYHETGISEKVKVLYCFDVQSKELNELLKNERIGEIYAFIQAESKEKGLNKLENEDYESFIYVSSENEKNYIDIYTVNNATFLFSILSNYSNRYNTYQVATNNKIDLKTKENIEIERINTTKDMPKGIDYYAIVSILQVLLFGGVFGIGSINEDKKTKTSVRLKAMPIKHTTKLFAYALADITAMMLMSAVAIVFSKHAFEANWSGNMMIHLLTIFLFCIVSEFLGMFLASITKSGVAMGIFFVVFLVWSKYAGAFDKIYNLSKIMYSSPCFHAKNILFYNIYGGTSKAIASSFLWLTLFAVAFILVTLLIERKNQHANI